jgi:hypothetical protein
MPTPPAPDRALLRGVLAWAPVAAWAGLIFAASAQPNLVFLPDASLDFVLRKLGHMTVFGILALLLWHAVARTTSARRPWAWAIALASLYAATDEGHQAFVAGRHASAVDVGIDVAGVLLAVAAAAIVVRTRSSGVGPHGRRR